MTLGVGAWQTGNVIQHRFRLTGRTLFFDKPLILKAFGWQKGEENGYEKESTRGQKLMKQESFADKSSHPKQRESAD